MLKSTGLAGIFAPVVTPFDDRADGLDLNAFATNIRAHLDAGMSGIVVAGSSGEAPLLSESERTTLVETARSLVPRDRWLIVGVGAESTRLTIERARAAAARGADGVLVVAPHYYPNVSTPAALWAHYARVADESPVPILLYNIPKYMHFALPPATVHRLAEHRNVIGMKDSAGDLPILHSYLQAQSSEFTVLTGHAPTFLSALRDGVRGGVLGVALIVPALALAIFTAAAEGRYQEAEVAQAQLVPLARDVVGAMGPAGIKAALDAVGLKGGSVRSPLLPVTPTERVQVAALVDAALAAAADVTAGARV